jgi:hypothetical protein
MGRFSVCRHPGTGGWEIRQNMVFCMGIEVLVPEFDIPSSLAAGPHHLRHRLELPPPRGLLLGLNPPVLPHLRLLEGLTEQHWDLSTATAV